MTRYPQFPEKGKAFVTGASGGIGSAIVRLFLNAGWEVWGTARSDSGPAGFSSEAGFHSVILDLNDRQGALDTFQKSADHAGEFDAIVNNAGYGVFCPFDQISIEDFDRQISAMVTTTLALVHAQMKLLGRQERGTLVNVSSLAVEFPLPFMAGYNVAKAALSALSESLMLETANSDVVVIDFRPGDIKTGFNEVMASRARKVIDAAESKNVEHGWKTLEKNIALAPSAESAAETLWRAMKRGRAGTVRCGGLFQAKLAPVLIRLIPQNLARLVRWRYFGIKSGG